MPDQRNSKSIDYEVFVDEVTNIFIKEVKKEFGFDGNATGGSMPYDIEEIHVGFSVPREVTIDEARELEVKLVEKFLSIVNAYEKIHPYLREYPFTSSRASILLNFYNEKKQPKDENNVNLVFQAKKNIFYKRYIPEKHSFIELAQEPYEEALKIVQNKSSNEKL